MRDLVNDSSVEVVSGSSKARPPSPPTRLDTEMFAAIERAQKRMFPDAITLPVMLAGATDSAQLRAKGVQAYGIGSVMTEEESNRFHGNDERISVDGLRKFLEFTWLAVIDIAAAK
jgi:acetylornithine deacetylase/succinyl-diaminopimelate desuccinylase-like protein